MNTLIVEDDEHKLGRIRAYLSKEFVKLALVEARSYKSGLRALVNGSPDLVILDMSLPNFDIAPGRDGGRPLNLGGKELLRQMKRRHMSVPVVVVTQFDVFGDASEPLTLDQLRAELAEEYPDQFVGAVFYQATADDWQEHLSAYLHSIRVH